MRGQSRWCVLMSTSLAAHASPPASAAVNQRQEKPRVRGVTEIRGPYYTPMGPRYLEDVLETMGRYVDALKFAGGSFTLLPSEALGQTSGAAPRHDGLVSTGGFIEYVVTQGNDAVSR